MLPVPWDSTVSYHTGAAKGPNAILEASPQLDFHLPAFPEAWRVGYALERPLASVAELNTEMGPVRDEFMRAQETENNNHTHLQHLRKRLNDASEKVLMAVNEASTRLLTQGKSVGVIGGEHSAPLGLLQALGTREPGFGILQLDAHADLRNAFMGLKHSHASIMFNALELKGLQKLVQVGLRDVCQEEAQLAKADSRVDWFTQADLNNWLFGGSTWHALCQTIVKKLPQRVYVSFDIDGLDPSLCPHTGTPVPDGLGFGQAMYLLEQVVASGRTIIGFDLCEVAPHPTDPHNDFDANVGARVLWRLCTLLAASKGLKPLL